MKQNIFNVVENLLKQNDKYIAEDGKLLKAVVYSDVMTMDSNLLDLLLKDEDVKGQFFKDINGTLVFDKQQFAWFLESKEFLPDSYTKYTNKIGLTSKGEFLSKTNDVVLDFPYKDCYLEGGQDRDDQKRKEIFYNEIIASDEVRKMLAPKVFTNAKRYTKDGVEEKITFNEDDNLIIKGNNLIALSSLLKRYEGKVKCIYIDPPYNTGNDSFNYNDNFNHSTWLTFMKNRLELAKRLLREDGSIFINLDYNEVHYCKVLMDDIFGLENFQREIIWRIGWLSGYKTAVKNFIRNHDTILFYSKSNKFYFNKKYIENGNFKDLISLEKIKQFVSTNNLNKEISKKFYDYINHESRIERYPLEDVWNANEYDDLNSIAIVSFSGETVSKMLDADEIKGQKSEKLIERIIEATTISNDIVLDFHLGSGTTCAVAHKMGRQYIGVEQMDYIQDITVERMKKVIEGEQGGISKSVNWQGGGSFVYCELFEDSASLIGKIQSSTEENIIAVKEEIYRDERIVPYITTEELKKADEEFDSLNLDEKKQALISLVDKNKLYVNYSDMEDTEYHVSKKDKDFTKSFYHEV